jgi:hypothetical protein
MPCVSSVLDVSTTVSRKAYYENNYEKVWKRLIYGTGERGNKRIF